MFRSFWLGLILVLAAGGLAARPQETPAKELVQYVQDAKKAGLNYDQIQKNAEKAGWAGPTVKAAIEYVRKPPKPAATKQTAVKSNTQTPPTEVAQRTAPPITKPDTPESAPVEPRVTPAAAAPPAAAPPAAAPPVVAPNGDTPPRPTNPAPVNSATMPVEAAGAKPAIDRRVPDEYRLGEGDVIQVSVWGEREASLGGVVIRTDGMITMPLIKDVHVAGLTPREAEKLITDLLSQQIKAADVTVIVTQTNSKKIFLLGGGVKKEGPLPYTYRMTVMQALSEAGGLSDYAKRKKIYILRNENGRQFRFPFDYDKVLKGEHMELDIPLLPFDTVVVPNH